MLELHERKIITKRIWIMPTSKSYYVNSTYPSTSESQGSWRYKLSRILSVNTSGCLHLFLVLHIHLGSLNVKALTPQPKISTGAAWFTEASRYSELCFYQRTQTHLIVQQNLSWHWLDIILQGSFFSAWNFQVYSTLCCDNWFGCPFHPSGDRKYPSD